MPTAFRLFEQRFTRNSPAGIDMTGQAPAAQHAYCPAQFEFVKQKPKIAASKSSPKGSGANTVSSTSTAEQNGSQAADSQLKHIRLPDAPLAIRQMPLACPTKVPSGVQTVKSSNQLTATFKEQPALPLRPAPSSSPAWNRSVRQAPGLIKTCDTSLISRLSKLTSAKGSPLPSGHVADVVPPHYSQQSSLHSSHQSSHQPPHHPPLPHPSAISQAAQAQEREHSGSTADHNARPQSQHSPGSSRQLLAGAACDHAHKPDTQAKQGTAHRLQTYPSATAPAPAELPMPNQMAAQSKHRWEEYDHSWSMEVDCEVEQAHSPATQPSPPSQPDEPQVKPKSTQRSRLQLQRPLGTAVTPSPAATHSTADAYRPAGITSSAQAQASRPSCAPGTAELDRSQPPGHPSGDPPGQPLGCPPRQPFGDPSRDSPGHPLGYPSSHFPGHSPQHPFEHSGGLRHPPNPDAAADTPSASGGMPNRPSKGSVDEHALAGASALQVPPHNLVLTAAIAIVSIVSLL